MPHTGRASRQTKRGLSEGQLAVLLVLPVLIVIGCISVYPILKTLWYSMFDLRLNHPTRNDTHFTCSLDLEKYADGIYTFHTQINKALEKASDDEEKQAVQALEDAAQSLADQLFNTQERLDKLEQVNGLIDAYQPVNDDQLRYMALSTDEAETLKTSLTEVKELAESVASICFQFETNR